MATHYWYTREDKQINQREREVDTLTPRGRFELKNVILSLFLVAFSCRAEKVTWEAEMAPHCFSLVYLLINLCK